MKCRLIHIDKHHDEVNALAISSDGGTAVSASMDNTLKVWDVGTGLASGTLKGHDGNVVCIVISPDDKYVISGSWDNTIRVWDLESLEQSYQLDGHTRFVSTVAIIPQSGYLASGSDDNTIRIWKWREGKHITSLEGHNHSISGLVITQDGKRIISASRDGSIKIWSIESRSEVVTLNGHKEGVVGIWLTPDQNHLISSSIDRTLKLWDLISCKEVFSFNSRHGVIANAISTSDGRFIITSPYEEPIITIWDLQCYKEDRQIHVHKQAINSLSLTPNEQYLVTGSKDRNVKLLDLQSGEQIWQFTGDSDILTCAVSPDGSTIIAGEKAGRVHCLRLEGERILSHNRGRSFNSSKATYIDSPGDNQCLMCGDPLTDEGVLLPDRQYIDIRCFVGWLNSEDLRSANQQANISIKCCFCHAEAHDDCINIPFGCVCPDCLLEALEAITKRTNLDGWPETELISALSLRASLTEKLTVLFRFNEVIQRLAAGSFDGRSQLMQHLVANLGFVKSHSLAAVIRQLALNACIFVGEPIVPFLLKLCQPEPWQFYANVILALGSIAPDNPSVQNLLREASKHDNENVRLRVVLAVDHYDSIWSRDLLENMLFDPNPAVADHIREVITNWDIDKGLPEAGLMQFRSISGLTEKISKMSEEKSIHAIRSLARQLAQAGKWDQLLRSLTDIEFIGMKANFGLADELLQDYNLAREMIPKGRQNGLDTRIQQIETYTKWLITFSRNSKQVECPIPPSSEELKQPINTVPTELLNPLETIKVWEHFVRNNTKALEEGHICLFQMAYNDADSGPVSQKMEQLLQENYDPGYPWLRLVNRAEFIHHPALVSILESPETFINCVAVDSLGKTVISGGSSGSLYIWDVDRHQLVKIIQAHEDEVSAIAITSDASLMVSGSHDQTLKVWDLLQTKCIHVLKGHNTRINSVAVTPGGTRAVSSGEDKTIRVWDLTKGKCINTIAGSPCGALAITADGRRLIWGNGIDGSISILYADTGECLARLEGHSSSVLSVSVTPDGRRGVSGSYDNTVAFWHLQSYECVGLYKGHTAWVHAVAITADGKIAVSAGGDGTLKIWDLEKSGKAKTLSGHRNQIKSIAISVDGRMCISGGDLGQLRVWDLRGKDTVLKEGTQLEVFTGLPNLNRIIFFRKDGRVCCSDLENDKGIKVLCCQDEKLYANHIFAASLDVRLGLSGHQDGRLGLWDLKEAQLLGIFQSTVGKPKLIETMPSGYHAMVIGENNALEIWDLREKQLLKSHCQIHESLKDFFVTSPDNRQAVFSTSDNEIVSIDLEAGEVSGVYSGHSHAIYSVIISHDGRWLISGSFDNTTRIWDTKKQKCLHIIEKKPSFATLVASPDNRRLILGDGFEVVMIDLISGRIINKLIGHTHFVLSILVSADGRFAATSSKDNTMRIWNVQTGKCVAVHASQTGICRPKIFAWPYILADTVWGKPAMLRFERIPDIVAPLTIACRLWLYGSDGSPGQWDKELTVRCYWCGQRFAVEEVVLGEEISCPNEQCGKKLKLINYN